MTKPQRPRMVGFKAEENSQARKPRVGLSESPASVGPSDAFGLDHRDDEAQEVMS